MLPFAVAWLISPVILIIVCICQSLSIKKLREENDRLRKEGSSEVSSNASSDLSALPHKAASYYDCYKKASDIPHDIMPENAAAFPETGSPVPISSDSAETETEAVTGTILPDNEPDSEKYGSSGYVKPSAAQYSYANTDAPYTKKDGASTINIILILGAMFITLAGFVFSFAAWGALNTFFKSVMLVSFSALFFGIHLFTERRLKLEATGRVFFVLGSVFLPAAAAAVGVLEVFGEYFSFKGGGRMLVAALMALLLSGCFLVGARHYMNRIYARVAYTAFTAMGVSLILHAGGDNTVWSAVGLSLFSLIFLLIEPFIAKISDGGVILKEYGFFTAVNVAVPAAISLFLSSGSGIFIVPSVLFSSCFFIFALREKNTGLSVTAFSAYLLAGMYLGIRPEEFEDGVLIAAAVMIVYTCLCMMDIVPDRIRRTASVIQTIVSAGVIAFGFLGGVFMRGFEDFSLMSFISAAAVFVQLAVLCVRREEAQSKVMCCIGAVWLAFETGSLVYSVNGFEYYATAAAAAVMFAFFGIVKLVPIVRKKLYSGCCDPIGCLFLIICLLCTQRSFTDSEWLVFALTWALCMAAAFISGKDCLFGKIAAPAVTLLSALPAYYLPFMTDRYPYSEARLICAFSAAAVLYFIMAAVAAYAKPLKKYAAAYSMGVPLTLLLYVFIVMCNDENMLAVPAAAAVFGLVNMLVNLKSDRIKLYSGYFLFSLCFFALDAGLLLTEGLGYLFFPAVAVFIMFGIFIMPVAEDQENKVWECLGGFLSKAIPLYASVMLIASYDNSDQSQAPAVLICGVLLTICGAAASVMMKRTRIMYINAAAVYLCGYGCLSDLLYDEIKASSGGLPALVMCAAMAVSCLAGRFIYRYSVKDGKDIKNTDFLSVSPFIGSLILLFDGGDFYVWAGFASAAVITLNLCRRGNRASFNRAVLTAAALLIAPVWWTQPFLVLPEIIELEWCLIPAAVFCVLFRIIHKGNPKASDNVSFFVAAASIVILFFSAIATGYAADAVMLGAVIVMILVVSFILRQKRWFVLSVVTAAAEALLLTVKLWNSSTWWIYLLAAGAVLIALGMFNEMNKQKSKDGTKKKITRFMSDWKW